MELKAPGRQNSWQQAKQAKLHSHPLPSKQREHLIALGSQQRGTLISVSIAEYGESHCPKRNNVDRKTGKRQVSSFHFVP